MAVFDLTKLQDDAVVFHFGGRLHEVDAYTFANTLLALADGLRDINQQINPDFSLEIRIDAIGSGSFRARLQTTKKRIAPLFKWAAHNYVVPVLVGITVERFLISDHAPNITINGDVTIYEYDSGDRVVMPSEAHERRLQIKDSQSVDRDIARAFSVLDEDPSIESFGFASGDDDKNVDIDIPRLAFSRVATMPQITEESGDKRLIDKEATLVIRRLILARSNRKWEFIWNGVPISAGVKDQSFFDRMEKREIAFAQGDALDVRLRINQIRDPQSGAWLNESYEVVEVLRIMNMPGQPSLGMLPPGQVESDVWGQWRD